jgi:hypothetical protein
MGRIITAVIAFSALGFLAYRAMYNESPGAKTAVSAPKQQLGNVHNAVHAIEANDQKYVDDAEKKTTGE